MAGHVRGDDNAPIGICVHCRRRLSDHKIGEWCRPGMTKDELAFFDRRDIRTKSFTADVTPPEENNMPSKRQPNRQRKVYDHSRWLAIVTSAVGADKPRPCPHCGGSGSVTEQLGLREAVQALLGVEYNMSASAFRKELDNPSLSHLEHIRDATGVDSLEAAAAWCRQIAQMIREALSE